MSSKTLDKSIFQSNYEFRLAKRKAEVIQVIEKHSNKLFGHTNASSREIRLEAQRRVLESTYTKS